MSEWDIGRLFERMASHGDGAYGLSDVTQLDHALQSAALADRRGLGDAMVVAALFHDVGHLLEIEDADLASQGIDDRHEESSADVLQPLFGESVSEPVRLHVAAKRYLCTVEPDYHDRLSDDLKLSLKLQGGTMTEEERAAFERHPFSGDGVGLRRIDDEAKVTGLDVPGPEAYRHRAERLAEDWRSRLRGD
ncbi:MAG: phosphohydrolase [Geminicoccaceae bacterium]